MYICISICVQLILANIIYYRFIVYVTKPIVCSSKFKIQIKADPYPFLSHSPIAVILGLLTAEVQSSLQVLFWSLGLLGVIQVIAGGTVRGCAVSLFAATMFDTENQCMSQCAVCPTWISVCCHFSLRIIADS